MFFMGVYRYGSAQSPGKKMPGEPGETGMMESAVHGWVSQGLQHEVIAMASCCKKGGGQKWEQLPPPKLHWNYGYNGPEA